MKALFFILCFLSSLIRLSAQCPEELVINGGFEDYLECPLEITANPTDLEELLGNWWSASDVSPDFYHYCGGLQGSFGGAYPENNVYGGQVPRMGSGMAGFAISCGDPSGEYIATKLLRPLVPTKQYKISYWISNGDSRFLEVLGVACRTNGIEILFTPMEIYWPDFTLMPNYSPQIGPASYIVTDSLNWVGFYQTFQVEEEYQYMTIGRWSTSVLNSNCTCFDPEIAGGNVYFYIDDISIKEVIPIEFPNVFTPNGDAYNRVFQVRGYCGNLSIYNRWGQLLVAVANDQGWNGRINGEDAPEGTYFCITDDQKHKGAFQLLR